MAKKELGKKFKLHFSAFKICSSIGLQVSNEKKVLFRAIYVVAKHHYPSLIYPQSSASQVSPSCRPEEYETIVKIIGMIFRLTENIFKFNQQLSNLIKCHMQTILSRATRLMKRVP